VKGANVAEAVNGYEVAVPYSEAIARQAARRYFGRLFRRDGLAAIGGLVLALVAWRTLGLDWLALILGSVSALLLGLVVAIWFVHTRAALVKVRAMRDPTVVWRLTTDHLSADSELGAMSLRWRSVARVWRFPEVWLLFFRGGHGYSTLPTEPLTAEIRQFIEARVRDSGGRVI
jgi:hypothetical protein